MITKIMGQAAIIDPTPEESAWFRLVAEWERASAEAKIAIAEQLAEQSDPIATVQNGRLIRVSAKTAA